MGNPKTSILLPSAYRHRNLSQALNALFDTIGYNSVEVLISLIDDDDHSLAMLEGLPVRAYFRTWDEYNKGAVYAWNNLASHSSGDILALWADDLYPQSAWLDRALRYIDDGFGLVGFNDLHTDGNVYAAHWCASRDWLNQIGGVMYPPQYHCWWADREMTERAQSAGRYVWGQDCIVEHRHFSFGAAPIDSTYQQAMPHYPIDERVYLERKATGYPIDYEPVMAVTA